MARHTNTANHTHTYATSKSIPTPPTLPKNSMAVTFAPSLHQTEPSSRPMTPAPIKMRCSGTCERERAPVELITVCSSN